MRAFQFVALTTGAFALLANACAAPASSTDEASTSAAADTTSTAAPTLRVPLLESVRTKKVVHGRTVTVVDQKLLEGRNALATANHVTPFPKWVEVSHATGPRPFNDAMKGVDKLNDVLASDKQIENVQYGAGPEFSTGRGASFVGLCYTGDPHKAMQLVQEMTDSIFSDQFVLDGYRYKTGKFTSDGKPMSAEAETESDLPELWKEWRGAGEAILMWSSIGDDGDDVNLTIVSKCR